MQKRNTNNKLKKITMDKEFVPYGSEWQKELKSKPKDFLVNFLRNSLMKISELEKENEELKNKLNS
jgi:hypothetical protein